jgi:hypothetical protein
MLVLYTDGLIERRGPLRRRHGKVAVAAAAGERGYDVIVMRILANVEVTTPDAGTSVHLRRPVCLDACWARLLLRDAIQGRRPLLCQSLHLLGELVDEAGEDADVVGLLTVVPVGDLLGGVADFSQLGHRIDVRERRVVSRGRLVHARLLPAHDHRETASWFV